MRRFLWLLCLLMSLPAAAEPVSDERVRAILPAFEAYVEQARKEWDVPAVALIVVRRDGVLHFRGMGRKSPSDPTPPDEDTLFAVGSTTKAFGAATLAMGVDDGKFDWDDRVLDHVPEFLMQDPWVTREFRVADLLAQHSGMPPYALTGYGELGYSPEAIVRAMKNVRPVSSFRSRFAYVNAPHLVAGGLVARTEAAPSWEEFLNRRLLVPLGMSRTSWTAEAFNAEPNRAVGHALVDGVLRPARAVHFPYCFGLAGALNSTPRDMARWVRLQLGDGTFEDKRLVSAANLEATRTPRTPVNRKSSYCMGWVLTWATPYPIVWHNGGTPGHRTMVAFVPEADLGIVILTNTGDNDLPDACAFRFFDMVFDQPETDYSAQFLEKHRREREEDLNKLARPDNPAPPRALDAYVGTWEGAVLGRVAIQEREGVLHVGLLDPGVEGVLEPWDGDVFTLRMTTPWLVQSGVTLVGRWTFAQSPAGGVDRVECILGDGESGLVTSLRRRR
ncbi:MAG: serine hydrolase [Candidatus Eremiobacterota bacterium]